MKLFKDLQFESLRTAARLTFDNGWGVSVISGDFASSSADAPYELAVIGVDGGLHYDNDVAQGGVRGYLTADEVEECMKRIQEFNAEI